MRLKLMIAATATTLMAETASSQVFIIGEGLGGECYQEAKRNASNFRIAEDICTRALREQAMTRKNRAATYVNRGVLRMRAGKYAESLGDYNEALKLQPELPEAFLNMGAALIYSKDFSSALSPLDRAIELESTDLFAAHYNRAIARENTGNINGAYDDFQTALELKPGWELAERQLNRFTVEDAS